MNRRQFTASLAALAATPILPFGAITPAAAAPVAAFPPGAYAWAPLVARAQNKCSPATLAQHLHLDANAATQLFNTMVRDGVLRAPGAVGIAQAANPIDASGTRAPSFFTKMNSHLEQALKPQTEIAPLVKAEDPALGCGDSIAKDDPDARTDQPVQESPQAR
jgi:hypothetical protein